MNHQVKVSKITLWLLYKIKWWQFVAFFIIFQGAMYLLAGLCIKCLGPN